MLNIIKETYKDFIDFIIKPFDAPALLQTPAEKFKKLLALLAIEIPIMIVLTGLFKCLTILGLVNMENHKISLLLLQQYPIWLMIFLFVILVPFVEELLFRFYLRYNCNFLSRAIILIASISGTDKKLKVEEYLQKQWHKYFRSIFYFSVLIFGLVHIFNFEYSIMIFVFAPILILPQITVGLICGYFRVKYGLIQGYFFHALHNLIFLAITLLFLNTTQEKLNVSTKNYKLSISVEKLDKIKPGTTTTRTTSSKVIDFQKESIKQILSYLLEKDINLIKVNNYKLTFQKINLKYEILNKDSLINKNQVVDHLKKYFGFKVIIKKEFQDIWELTVQDSILLAKNLEKIPDSKFSSQITTNSDTVTFKKGGMSEITKTLGSVFNCYIIDKTGVNNIISISVPVKNFDGLQVFLNMHLGLKLRKTKMEVDNIIVE